MIIPLLYTASAITLLFLGILAPWTIASIFLWWTSFSLAVISVGYWANNHQIFRKRSNGSIPLMVRAILWPALLGAAGYNHWRRYTDKGPAFHSIADKLYVGSRLFQKDVHQLRDQGIVAILDVTAEFNGLNWSQDNSDLFYLSIPILDHRTPSNEQVHKAINWIHNHIKNERPVIVHCALGKGRSVLTCAAYLAALNPDKSIHEIINSIQKIRSVARLNATQQHYLKQLHNQKDLHLGPDAAMVINPVAGGKKWEIYKHQIVQQLSQTFQLTLFKTSKEVDAHELTREALKTHPSYVFAGGGDGTVNQVASELVFSDTALGIIPLGTANALYKAILGEQAALAPIDIACDVLERQHTEQMDTINCNGALSLLMVGLGFESEMIRGADRDAKNDSGQMAYLRSFLRALNEGNALSLSYQLDDQPEFQQETASVVIANTAPLSSLLARGGGKPEFNDGQLSMTLIPHDENVTGHITNILELLMDNITPGDSKFFSSQYTPKKVKIAPTNSEESHTLHYVIDGEVFSAKSLEIEIQPASLRILSPATKGQTTPK